MNLLKFSNLIIGCEKLVNSLFGVRIINIYWG